MPFQPGTTAIVLLAFGPCLQFAGTQTASAWLDKGNKAMKAGELRHALNCYEKGILAVDARDPDLEMSSSLLLGKAHALLSLQRFAEAVKPAAVALRFARQAAGGGESIASAECLSFLGAIHLAQSQYEVAGKELEAAATIQRNAGDTPSGDIVKTQVRLGHVMLKIGQLNEAHACFDAATRALERADGQDPFDVMSVHYLKLDHCIVSGANEEARTLAKRVLRFAVDNLGPNHRDTAYAYFRVGLLAIHVNDYKEALPRLDSAIDIFTKTDSPDDRLVLECHFNRGFARFKTRDLRGAFSDMKKVFEGHVSINGTDVSLESAKAVWMMGLIRQLEGKSQEAEELVARGLKLCEQLENVPAKVKDAMYDSYKLILREQGKLKELGKDRTGSGGANPCPSVHTDEHLTNTRGSPT